MVPGSNPGRPTFSDNMQFTKSIVFYLIMLNFFVFFIEAFVPIDSIRILGLVPESAIYHGMVWQFVTFLFVHGSFMHIFFNMFVLFMFGPTIEMEFGRKKFLIFYLICGIGSALLHMFLAFTYPALTNPENIAAAITTPLIGASGSVMGILTISSDENKILELQIFDLSGKILLLKKNLQTNEKINISELKNGVYLLQIKTEKAIFTEKIIKN